MPRGSGEDVWSSSFRKGGSTVLSEGQAGSSGLRLLQEETAIFDSIRESGRAEEA